MQKTFQVHTRVGMEAAKVLAGGWSHRMQYLYDSHRGGRTATQAQADAIMAACVEPENFHELLAGGVGAIQMYGVRIRGIRLVA